MPGTLPGAGLTETLPLNALELLVVSDRELNLASVVQSLNGVWLSATPRTICSTPGFPVLYRLPELAQTHVHWDDAIQPSHPMWPPDLALLKATGDLAHRLRDQDNGTPRAAQFGPRRIRLWLSSPSHSLSSERLNSLPCVVSTCNIGSPLRSTRRLLPAQSSCWQRPPVLAPPPSPSLIGSHGCHWVIHPFLHQSSWPEEYEGVTIRGLKYRLQHWAKEGVHSTRKKHMGWEQRSRMGS